MPGSSRLVPGPPYPLGGEFVGTDSYAQGRADQERRHQVACTPKHVVRPSLSDLSQTALRREPNPLWPGTIFREQSFVFRRFVFAGCRGDPGRLDARGERALRAGVESSFIVLTERRGALSSTLPNYIPAGGVCNQIFSKSRLAQPVYDAKLSRPPCIGGAGVLFSLSRVEC